ncbi:MAG TPA: hypothetical protein VLB01_06445, partial [Thermodesulfobacteriota bacterium]|nr:hypothetical protein [Thermodesulfobacteriota bacterium]
FSLATYKQVAFNQHFLDFISSNLDLDLTSIKSHPNYQNIISFATIAAKFCPEYCRQRKY